MLTRRQFLKLTAAGGVSLLLPGNLPIPQTLTATPLDPSTLTKYADSLPFPIGVVKPSGKFRGADYYEVTMTQFTQKLHSELGPTTLWGYTGQYPAKTIEVRTNQRIFVKWINNISNTEYLIPDVYDRHLHGTHMGEPEVKTVVHVHGAHVPPEGDGYPEAWFTKGFAQKGPAFTTEIYEYPNKQEATTLWYHDHAIGQTRLNVYAGLAGFYVIRDAVEDGLNLPKGNYEVPLVIQDRMFDVDGSLLYPVAAPEDKVADSHEGPWVPEFFGDTMLVNGKVWPYFEVEPRKYRFRILNGCNARFLNLRLSKDANPTSDVVLSFNQIGAEQSLFAAPVKLNSLLMTPAERADVIIDFSSYAGKTLYLTNDARSPYPDGDPVDANTAQIMQFKVKASVSVRDTSSLPAKLRPVQRLPESSAVVTRNMAFREYMDSGRNPIIVLLNGKKWDDPITDKPQLGTTEIWNLINTTGDAHPIHLHDIAFQVLDRQAFDVDAYLNAWGATVPGAGPDPIPVGPYLQGNRILPAANEMAWKDTVRAMPGEVTRIIVRFDQYKGKFPWHCHIVEHEDNEMMLQFEVVAGSQPSKTAPTFEPPK